MFSVPGMCRWTGYSFHHSCSRAGYRFLQKCSQKGILFSNSCSQTGLRCIFLILCSQTGCAFLPFCSQTGVFKLRKMLSDRVKITAPQRHTPVHIRTKCPPGDYTTAPQHPEGKGQFPVSGIVRAGGILDNKKLLSRNYPFNFRATFSLANKKISARSENSTNWKSALRPKSRRCRRCWRKLSNFFNSDFSFLPYKL